MKARYLTVKGAAEYLSMTPQAVYDRVRRGSIPVIRDGRTLRFDIQDLDLMMRRNRVEAS